MLSCIHTPQEMSQQFYLTWKITPDQINFLTIGISLKTKDGKEIFVML